MSIRKTFDQSYYERFYGGARDRREYLRDEEKLGQLVCAWLRYLEQPVERVVDIGCGFGHWQTIIKSHFPRARYTGVELSPYLCERFGWTQASVTDFRSKGAFDLVICKDILQYLSTPEFDEAVGNLSKLCRGVLYASIVTREDWEEVCDRRRTDPDVHFRTGAWYRRRLGREFANLGGGLFLSPRSPVLVWELEKLPARGA